MGRARIRTWVGVGGVALALPLYANCVGDTRGDANKPKTTSRALSEKNAIAAGNETVPLPAHVERVIAWGDGQSELRSTPHVDESVAYGPSAVALLPDGRALILDRLAGRIVRVGAGSALETVAAVPVDALDLVTAEDGAFAAFSPMRARAFVFGADADAAGEVSVPRALHDLSGISLARSHRILARTGYQETLVVGSPSATLPLPVTLASKREGAFQLADGRGVVTRVSGDTAFVEVVTQSSGDSNRSRVVQSHAVPGAVSAARLFGLSGKIACMRTERVSSTPKISVERRAVCVDVETGQVALDRALQAPGLYLPGTELALGGGRVAFIHPEPDGLRFVSDAVAELGGAQ